MAHCNRIEADTILDIEYPVLDKGYVALVDYLGDDSRIAQAARVSYSATEHKEGDNTNIIETLMRERHTSPFEQVSFTFRIKLPIFVARQLVRHRTAKLNELSARYSEMTNEIYEPNLEDVRGKVTLTDEEKKTAKQVLVNQCAESYATYKGLVDGSVARELARSVLPVGAYTKMFWTIDLHNLLHFLELRISKHSQLEIRKYAETMLQIIEKVCPIAVKAFREYRLGATIFTYKEMMVLLRSMGRSDLIQPEMTDAEWKRFKTKLGY